MKLAILGADAVTVEIARRVATTGAHKLVALCECEGSSAASLRELGVPIYQNWEDLLDASRVDAVVVGQGPDPDRRTEQLRKLLQAEMPVLASHPIGIAVLDYYELEMVRREKQGVLLPYLPLRTHPAMAELSSWISQGNEGPLGRVEQVVFERQLADRGAESVKRQFASDVDLLRCLCGEPSRLGAMAGGGHSGDKRTAFTSLNIQMSGDEGILVRWSILPGTSAEFGRLQVLGSAGQVHVTIPTGEGPWTFDAKVAGGESLATGPAGWHPVDAMLAELDLARGGQPPTPDWGDAVRCIELTDTIDRSLRRGRTIELNVDERSEEGAFKSLMSAAGCGVLIAGIMVLLLVAVAEDFAQAMGLKGPLNVPWPYLLLGLLAVFLLLQGFLVLARSHSDQEKTPFPLGEGGVNELNPPPDGH